MAKNNTLNDLNEFLKSTQEASKTPATEGDFLKKTPHQLVDIDQVRPEQEEEETPLQAEELMARISELAQREGLSKERFLAKLLQQTSQQEQPENSSWYLPDLLVQGSFVAYNMAVMFKDVYEYFTQSPSED